MSSPAQDAPSDLQEHLARLTARGLVTRIERPINKDTELHPLARWQFQGGLRDEERRAFLFTNVVGAGGESYDIPVLVGGLAASPEIYATGLGVRSRTSAASGSKPWPSRSRRCWSTMRRARKSS